MLRLTYIVVVGLAAVMPAIGQVAPGIPASPPDSTLTTAAGPRPTPSQTVVAPRSAEEENVKLQFPNSDVVDVLHFYEELTSKKLVMDNNVTGKVNIFISKPITRDEAIKIIEMNLLLNGYALVAAENDIVKVIGSGKNPRSAGVPIISDESDIPDGDHVISYLFKLHYADPQELQQVLGQYLSPAQSYTSFLALPKSSSILVTESSDVIRKLVKVVDQVDIPPAEVVSEFIKLDRADAGKVVDMLHDIFERGAQNTPNAPARGGIRPVIRQPQPVQLENGADVGALIGLSEESVIVGKIKLTADVRTNRIHVITRPINMPFIRRLIGEFDANVEFAKPVTRPLRYVSAGDVLPVLVQALSEPGEEQQGGGTGQPTPPQQQQQRQNNYNPASNPSNSASESTLNVSEELSTQPVDTTPKAVTVGNAKIIADQRSNAIIVLGNRQVVVKVQKILDELDMKAPQVALSTVIGELTLNNDEEFGIDYFAKYKNKVVGISRNTSVPIPLPTTAASPSASVGPGILDPSGLVNFGQILQQVGSGTNVYIAAGNYLAAIVHALDSTDRFKVISRPMVFTSNNKKAIIASGTEIPVPVSTLSSVVNGGITGTNIGQQSSIEYKKVALQLEVVPLINSEKEVSLDILQKIDSLAGATTVDGNSIPNIATRYIRTSVSAPNGATIVLGGLIMDSKEDKRSGIPVLDRLPLVGALFRNTGKTKNRTELIILMRPEVSFTGLDQYHLRRKEEDKTHFGPEIDQEGCPDCPPRIEGKETRRIESGKDLPAPDLPPVKS